MVKIRGNLFAAVVSLILVIVFLINLILSREYNLFMILLTGGGKLMDSLAASYFPIIREFQFYRSITYGYLHPTVWHLAANVFALWYVGLYMEKVLNKAIIFLIYHAGLIISGIVFILILPDGYMYGASPAIFCFLGMMTVWLLKGGSAKEDLKNIRGYRYLLGYMIISNFLSFGTFIVHLTGFCAGIILGLCVKKSC